MWVERCQERSFVHKMYLKKCLQSIGLCVHCCSSQFVCYLFHRHGFMVLSDDGLVQVAWLQTYPYIPVWLPWKRHWRDPWCWLNLLRDDFLFYQVIQFLVYCLLGLDWHLPSWHALLAWLKGLSWCCRLLSSCQVCQMSWGIVSSNPPWSCMTLSLVHGRLVLPCCLAICLCRWACGWVWGLVDIGGDLCCWSEMSWYH